MAFAWLNGSLVEEDAATVSIRDTGLLHAAGVFTTMRSHDRKVFRLDAHLKRLRLSCEHLFVPLEYKDEQLAGAVSALIEKNGLEQGRLRLTVTRGAAHQDPLHGLHLRPNVFLTATSLEPYPEEFYRRGLTVVLIDDQKLNPFDLQAGYKTLNYFSRLAGLREANRRGAGEGLWFNVSNFLQSGSISNVFVVKDGVLLTPPTPEELEDAGLAGSFRLPRSAVLPGITRAAVLELAKEEEIETRLAEIDINLLLSADEVFLTNSIMGVMPVCRIERKALADDRPGPITRRLSEAHDAIVRRDTA